jgi:hypothetical protein
MHQDHEIREAKQNANNFFPVLKTCRQQNFKRRIAPTIKLCQDDFLYILLSIVVIVHTVYKTNFSASKPGLRKTNSRPRY